MDNSAIHLSRKLKKVRFTFNYRPFSPGLHALHYHSVSWLEPKYFQSCCWYVFNIALNCLWMIRNTRNTNQSANAQDRHYQCLTAVVVVLRQQHTNRSCQYMKKLNNQAVWWLVYQTHICHWLVNELERQLPSYMQTYEWLHLHRLLLQEECFQDEPK